jgi:hypothetical protein
MDYDNTSCTLLPYLSYPLHGMILYKIKHEGTKTQRHEDMKTVYDRFLRVFASSCLCVYKKSRLPIRDNIIR